MVPSLLVTTGTSRCCRLLWYWRVQPHHLVPSSRYTTLCTATVTHLSNHAPTAPARAALAFFNCDAAMSRDTLAVLLLATMHGVAPDQRRRLYRTLLRSRRRDASAGNRHLAPLFLPSAQHRFLEELAWLCELRNVMAHEATSLKVRLWHVALCQLDVSANVECVCVCACVCWGHRLCSPTCVLAPALCQRFRWMLLARLWRPALCVLLQRRPNRPQ